MSLVVKSVIEMCRRNISTQEQWTEIYYARWHRLMHVKNDYTL